MAEQLSRRLAKVNYTTRYSGDAARLGLEMQFVSPRLNALNNVISGYSITNLTLGRPEIRKIWKSPPHLRPATALC